jgi:hypothetical protein
MPRRLFEYKVFDLISQRLFSKLVGSENREYMRVYAVVLCQFCGKNAYLWRGA